MSEIYWIFGSWIDNGQVSISLSALVLNWQWWIDSQNEYSFSVQEFAKYCRVVFLCCVVEKRLGSGVSASIGPPWVNCSPLDLALWFSFCGPYQIWFAWPSDPCQIIGYTLYKLEGVQVTRWHQYTRGTECTIRIMACLYPIDLRGNLIITCHKVHGVDYGEISRNTIITCYKSICLNNKNIWYARWIVPECAALASSVETDHVRFGSVQVEVDCYEIKLILCGSSYDPLELPTYFKQIGSTSRLVVQGTKAIHLHDRNVSCYFNNIWWIVPMSPAATIPTCVYQLIMPNLVSIHFRRQTTHACSVSHHAVLEKTPASDVYHALQKSNETMERRFLFKFLCVSGEWAWFSPIKINNKPTCSFEFDENDFSQSMNRSASVVAARCACTLLPEELLARKKGTRGLTTTHWWVWKISAQPTPPLIKREREKLCLCRWEWEPVYHSCATRSCLSTDSTDSDAGMLHSLTGSFDFVSLCVEHQCGPFGCGLCFCFHFCLFYCLQK